MNKHVERTKEPATFRTEDVFKLIEANRLMSDLIDRIFLLLLQHMTVEEIETAGITNDAEKAAKLMHDFQ